MHAPAGEGRHEQPLVRRGCASFLLQGCSACVHHLCCWPRERRAPSGSEQLLLDAAGIETTSTVTSPPRPAAPPADRARLLPKGAASSASDTSDASDDVCPTCLEAYTVDNPRMVAKCGHHYHLPCIYAWLERSPTCPMCGRTLQCDELVE